MAVSTALPPGDRELPLSEHLRELRNRIAIVLGVTILLTLVAFPFSEGMISAIWGHIMPPYVNMTVYEPLEILKVRITISFIFAVAVGFPLLVYEGFRFAAPGLFPHEKKFLWAIFPFSLTLFVLGALIAYFVTLPLFFNIILAYGADVAAPDLSLGETFSTVTNFMVGFGVVFQVPLVILLAIKMKLVTRKTLAAGRIAVYGILFTLAMLISPDPTMLSQIIVAIVLAILFEASLLLARFI